MPNRIIRPNKILRLDSFRLDRIRHITNANLFLIKRTPTTAEVLERWSREVIAHDEALGLKRELTPLVFPYLEYTPQARKFYSLAQCIKDVALFDVPPQNETQASWMRILQHLWLGCL